MRIAVVSLTIAIFCLSIGIATAQNTSDEARRYFYRGMAATETAKSTADYKNAAKEFEKAKAFAPDWPDVYYNLGMILEKTNDFEGAIKNLKTYLRLAPSSSDANQIQEKIYKLEYKLERSNIEGIWRVDKNEQKVRCSPKDYQPIPGCHLSSRYIGEDIVLEIKKELNEYLVRILSSKSRFGHFMPDGPYVTVKRDGDMIKIFDAKLFLCGRKVRSDNCPCDADFLLEQISADTLEGTVKINGIVKKGFSTEVVGLGCKGKIILRKQDTSR